MLLSKLLEGCGVTGGFADGEIKDVVSDSRKVTPGALFIARRGERSDGADYIDDAIARGAAAVVARDSFRRGKVIAVSDPELAEAVVYSHFFGDPARDMRIVAVTGTNGKTSTVSAIAHVLRSSGVKCGAIGTAELSADGEALDRDLIMTPEKSSMTTPDTEYLYRILSVIRARGCDTVVMEASSHALSRKRLSAMRIGVGAFTNLTPEHLDCHGTMEEYFEAKRTLADISDRIVTNFDDEYGRRIFYNCKNSLGVSADESLDCAERRRMFALAENARFDAGSVGYDCVLDGGTVRIESPVCGRFALYNTLTAAAVSFLLGIGRKKISDALATFRGAPGRMERVFGKDGAPTAFIDYAHTPDALGKALRNVKENLSGRLILVFGCGGDRDRTKRAPMGEIACRLADYTVVTNDNPRSEDPDGIIRDIVSGFYRHNFETVPDRREAIIRAVALSNAEDTVICCGKGHEKYIIDKCGKHYFDEKQILLEALEEKYRTVGKNEG